MSDTTDLAVVGAGILGLAVAREMLARDPDRSVRVVEREDRVGAHQTGHNSGVVHAGIYYPPGSLKAVLCRRGVELLQDFCAEHRLDYRAVAGALAADIHAAGGTVRLGTPVTAVSAAPAGPVTVRAGDAEDRLDGLVVCAGLQSDLVARMAGDAADPVIVPFRGEYYRLRPERAGLVRGLVYPVPDPAYPFLGVHFTPRVDGPVDIGPNAVLATAREGYRRRDVAVGDVLRILRSPGARRLFRQHWRAGLAEVRGSLSKHAYVAGARDYVPELTARDVVRAPAGIRAQAVDRDGTLVDDFRISRLGSVTAVRNAPSPAATSCLAIAEHLVDRLTALTAR